MTLPPPAPAAQARCTRCRRRAGGSSESFQRLGFSLAVGPHVEHSKYNFDDLNVPQDHPARDMADTFFVRPHRHPGFDDDSDNDAAMRLRAGELVLRTHTSPVQVRTMLKPEAADPDHRARHHLPLRRRRDPQPDVPPDRGPLRRPRGDHGRPLGGTLMDFTRDFYGRRLDVRFRPSFFPFVEPGCRVRHRLPFCGGDGNLCKRTGYIEIGGCGMVHPAVFEACGIDPEVYTGWAFGFGVDRMTMSQHAVQHLRHMFEGDVRLLEQFRVKISHQWLQ